MDGGLVLSFEMVLLATPTFSANASSVISRLAMNAQSNAPRSFATLLG